MNNSKLRLFVVSIVIFFMVSCGKHIPRDVIQPVEMENLLYDYHLALTMGNDLSYDERYKRELYKEYVFKKHNVTEAQFDSSMVWYTRNSKELTEIYKKLQKRFDIAKNQMFSQLNKKLGQREVSRKGDSVDVWMDRSLYWLTTSPLTNNIMFDLKVDTTFHKNDILVLSADFSFLSAYKREKTPKVVVALNVIFKNDSTQAVTKVIDKSGHNELCLVPDSAYEYKSLNGFIYYNNSDSLDASALIRNIKLMRYRKGSYKVKETMVVTDSKEKEESKENKPVELKQITDK